MLQYWHEHKDKNILLDVAQARAKRQIPTEQPAYLGATYSQIALQSLRLGGQPLSPKDYTDPIDTPLMESIETVTSPCYRTRISALEAGGTIPEHIDDPQYTRTICVLSGFHEFRLQVRKQTHSITMCAGELWFVNTAWSHQVHNSGDECRVALLINTFDEPEFSKTEILNPEGKK